MSASTITRTAIPDRETGVLLVGGDWAIAHGDPAGLADVANRLCDRMTGSACADLRDVALLCRSDPEDAVRRWLQLRNQLRAARPSAANRRP